MKTVGTSELQFQGSHQETVSSGVAGPASNRTSVSKSDNRLHWIVMRRPYLDFDDWSSKPNRIFVGIIILTGVREAESKSTVAGVAVLLRFSFHVPLDGRLNEVTGALFFFFANSMGRYSLTVAVGGCSPVNADTCEWITWWCVSFIDWYLLRSSYFRSLILSHS